MRLGKKSSVAFVPKTQPKREGKEQEKGGGGEATVRGGKKGGG